MPRPKKYRRVCDFPQTLTFLPEDHKNRERAVILTVDAVSYTHLTLPTIRSV